MEFWKPLLLHKCWQDILFTTSLKVKETRSPEDSFFQLLISIKANFGSNLMINIKYGKSSNWAFLFITPILLYCWGTLKVLVQLCITHDTGNFPLQEFFCFVPEHLKMLQIYLKYLWWLGTKFLCNHFTADVQERSLWASLHGWVQCLDTNAPCS